MFLIPSKEDRLRQFQEDQEYKAKKQLIIIQARDMISNSWVVTFTKKWVKRLIAFSFVITIDFLVMCMFSSEKFLNLSDGVIDAIRDVVMAYDSGVLLSFVGYLGKALFESKWEDENKLARQEKGLIAKDCINVVKDDQTDVSKAEDTESSNINKEDISELSTQLKTTIDNAKTIVKQIVK